MEKLADISAFESLGASGAFSVMNDDATAAPAAASAGAASDGNAIKAKLRRALILAGAVARKTGQSESTLQNKVLESFQKRYQQDYTSGHGFEEMFDREMPEYVSDVYDQPYRIKSLDSDDIDYVDRDDLMDLVPWVMDNDYGDLDAEGNKGDQELIDYLKEERKKRLMAILRAVTKEKRGFLPDSTKSYEDNLRDIRARMDEARGDYENGNWRTRDRIRDYVFGDRDSYADDDDD